MENTFDDQLARVNQGLKAEKLGVTLCRRKNRLYIRAMFPPRPGSRQIKPNQQYVSTGCAADKAGLRLAEAMAREIAAKLAGKTFDWRDYGVDPVEPDSSKTAGQWIVALETDYFQRRPRTSTTEKTWKIVYWYYLKRLPQELPLTAELLHQTIVATDPDTLTRSYLCIACTALGKFAGLDVDFIRPLKGSYSSKNPKPRKIPSDDEIVQVISGMTHPGWRWVAGMLATYGLRPHEVFCLDFLPDNWVEVGAKTKTGCRCVPPLHPEWVEEFNLSTPCIPKVSGLTNTDIGDRVSQVFRRVKFPFRPYDLRHAWAIRALRYDVEISMAARWMGHSVQVHARTYQRWISELMEDEIFNAAIDRSILRNRCRTPSGD